MKCTISSYSLPKAFTPHGIMNILTRNDSVGSFKNIAHAHRRRRPWEDQDEEMDRRKRSIWEDQEERQSKSKKLRTTFSVQQVSILERMFEHRKYINSVERSYISRCST